MHLLVICPHPQDRAPAQRLKFEQYYPSWRAAGFEVDVRPFWAEGAWDVLYESGHRARKALAVLDGYRRRIRDVRDARKADLVYVFLEAAPVGPPVFERLIDRAAVPIVYDIDDLVYLPHSSAHNRFMRFFRNPAKILELMRMARQVIVCTDHLAGVAEAQNPHVTNISSTIDTDLYVPRPHRDVTSEVVLGWSGSHSTSPYLHLLDDVLRELQRTESIRIKVIGDGQFRIPGAAVAAQPWRLRSEVADLSEIDVGLYPLPDEEWVLGKSGLKALQYMALGIPTVAQRIGANLGIIEHGVNGLLAGSPAEWVECLLALIRDPELRRRLGEAGRQTVVERYSVRATEPKYLAILTQAGRRPQVRA
jgi:glycosyltransferase involved in cell wall biosynthesis